MKKILILMITTVMLFGWEINTHRAIDRSAINESKKDGNLKSFIENSGIDTKYKYLNEKYEGYTKKDGTAFSYFDYIDKGEEGGISDWNQTFAGKDNIQDAIEAGTILEDAQWADHPWFGANGRFLNHFADPQNGYKGFSLGEANALSWATGVARHYPGVNPYLQDSNQYDYLNALEYFKDGFVSKQLDERRRYQAKMLVSVGHILHLMNDMNVPAHTRDDAHPNGDALEVWARGGLDGKGARGFHIIASSLNVSTPKMDNVSVYHFGNLHTEENEGQLYEYMKKEAKFTGTHFFSGYAIDTWDVIDTIEKKALPAKYHEANCYVAVVPDVKQCYIVSDELTSHNKLAIRVKSYFYNRLGEYVHEDHTQMRGGDMTTFQGDMSVLEDNAWHLIPRAVANAEGFLNYFFRGQMEAEANPCGVKVTNISDASTVAGDDIVTFKKGGTLEVYYDNKKGERKRIGAKILGANWEVKDSVVIPLDISLGLYNDMDGSKTLTIVYDGDIGNERGLSVTTLKLEEPKDSNSTISSGGLFSAEMTWGEHDVHMELSNKLMSESESGCGYAKADSGSLSLNDVYPDTYPLNVINVNGYEDLDDNISDTIFLGVHAVTRDSSDYIEVTNKYLYANLGENQSGHVADIVISKDDDPKAPIKTEVIPHHATVDWIRYIGWYNTSNNIEVDNAINYSIPHYSIPTTTSNPPLCSPAQSCGCLPCKYSILMFLNQSRLGPISGASVKVYKASQDDKANREYIYEGYTSVSTDINHAGVISLPVPYPQQTELSSTQQAFMDALDGYDGDLVIEVSGGSDIDSDDNLEVDSSFKEVDGSLHLIVTKDMLLQNDYKVNILTEIAYELSRDLLGDNYDAIRLDGRLDDIAKRVLLDKIYQSSNNPLNRDDLMYWNPMAHKNWLVKSYDELQPIVDEVYNGDDISADAYRYVYDKPDGTKEILLQSQWFSVDENISSGSYIGDIKVDAQGSSPIERYELSGESDKFRIENNGSIYLKDDATLDYEDKESYHLYLKVYNHTQESKPVSVYVDVANIYDAPEPKGFSGGVVSEDAKEGDVVGHIDFASGASDIEHIDVGGVDADAFYVDNNGTIYVSGNAKFDYESKNYADITIQAFNSYGGSRIVSVHIVITDAVDVPIVKMLDITVDENTTVGTILGRVEILSNEPIESVTLTGEDADTFAVDTNGTLTLQKELDYEQIANYVLSLKASNSQGESRSNAIVIRVKDIADTPWLEPTTLHVMEHSPVGSVVGNVTIKSQGESPCESFTLKGNGSSYFSIDSNGTIKIAQEFSHDEFKYFDLRTNATNQEGTSLDTQVVIYVDTQRPVLGILDTWVYENAPTGTQIGRVPVANEGIDNITSMRLEGDGANLFAIDANGNISVVADIDYEQKSSYNLQAYATNSAGESEASRVYIRVINQDDTIEISGFGTTIYEDIPEGTLLGFVKVLHSGGKDIDHFVLDGSGSEHFEIDHNGFVTIKSSGFDDKVVSSYRIGVVAYATDGTKSDKAYIDIYIKDAKNGHPILNPLDISIKEDTAIGTKIGKVEVVTSGSSDIERFVLDGGNGVFSIDENGDIYLNQALDYEEKTNYKLYVTAYNHTTQSTPSSVSINVVNIPDTPPTIDDTTLSIVENSLDGTTIGDVSVKDVGEGNITGFTLLGDGSDMFSIDDKGTIKVAGSLDYEKQNTYHLNVIAHSSLGDSNEADLYIKIEDVPDVVPVLNNTKLEVRENKSVGDEVGDINLTLSGDSDIYKYTLSGDGSDTFFVDKTGSIVLKQLLDYDKINSYVLKVKAFNEAGVSNEALLDITVLPNDEQKPTIALIGSSHVYQVEHSVYQDSGAIAFDNIDGDITNKITVNNPVNTDAEVGTTFTVTYNVSDYAGNSAIPVSRLVTIIKDIDVNLQDWKSEGEGNWQVADDNRSVMQVINGEPTVFFNDTDSQNEVLSLKGEIEVSHKDRDDDFIGFVLGYHSHDLSNDDANYILIDWKRANQGTAKVGLAISRVTTSTDDGNFGAHSAGVSELQRGYSLAHTGWSFDTPYKFDIHFHSDNIKVYINDKLELDINGTFQDGSFGFYNYSQAQVTYKAINADNNLGQKPVANAGEDATYELGESITLDGSLSYDEDGEITSYIWRDSNDTTLGLGEIIDIDGLSQGEHNITLSVFDNDGNEDTDSVEITVVSPE